MNDHFICLHGLVTAVTRVDDADPTNDYFSKYRCRVHARCFAVPCAWPAQQILAEWQKKETCKSALISEATKCSKCQKEGTFLCVYGGHMLCPSHVEPFTLINRKTKSPYQCLCEESKGSPVWPNPFAYLYMPSNAIVLEDGDTVANFSYMHFNFKFFVGSKIIVKGWQYPFDTTPTMESFDSSINRKRIIKWRLCVVSNSVCNLNFGKQNSRCYQFWKNSPVRLCQDRIKAGSMKKEPEQELFVHMTQLFGFLFALSRNEITCLNCKTCYAPKTFAESPCSIFTFEELKKNTKSCDNFFGNLVEC